MEASNTVAVESGYYEVAATETLSLDSEPVPIQPNQTYEAKASVVGFEGSRGCALLALIFLDETGKEVSRESTLVDDFSGRAKQYLMRAGVPVRAKELILAYRVNIELPDGCAPSTAKLWLGCPGLVSLSQENTKDSITSHPARAPVDGPQFSFRIRPGLSRDNILRKIMGVKHWYHRVEVVPGIFTPGINDSYLVLSRLGLPDNCTGLRVLDIGARDGFFSFVLEQRRAREVIAIDHAPPDQTGFPVLREVFDSKVQFCQDNVYNLSREKYGEFDIVLFLGVLYHLRNPLLALDRIRDLCRGQLFVESYVIDQALRPIGNASVGERLLRRPLMEFYPADELHGDFTNWWGPNSLCLRQMLESTGFTVHWQKTWGHRTILRCTVNENPHTSYFRSIEGGLIPPSA